MIVQNDGPDLVATDYWGSGLEQAAKYYASINAGVIRLLVPHTKEHEVAEMTAGVDYVILSRGPWPAARLDDAIELLFEDGSDSPYCLHLSPETFDLLPTKPEAGKQWALRLYVDGPKLVAEFPVRYRQVKAVPYLKPWGG